MRIYEILYFDKDNRMKIFRKEFMTEKEVIKYLKKDLKKYRNKKHKYAQAKLIEKE
jgi:hypothetical protein